MLDFLEIKKEIKNNNTTCIIKPSFKLNETKDLMIRGRDFYAIYDDTTKLWYENELEAIRLIDKELYKYYVDNKDSLSFYSSVIINYMRDSDSKSIDKFHHFVQKQARDSYHDLDVKLISASTETKRTDYCTKKLPYDIKEGSTENYDKLMDTIFDKEERKKLEWALGAILFGDSKKLQKFIVLYGGPGTGKSTFLHIIEDLFDGYYSMFDAKTLADKSNQFPLEAFKNNPLVAIQHDGDLSRINDNTRLNSIISHEKQMVNIKHKSPFEMTIKSFLFMGTNEPVDITSSKSGIIRRLIDVRPSGRTIDNPEEFDKIMEGIKFEHGAIAWKCIQLYNKLGGGYYKYYEARDMREETDDIYNFIIDYSIDYLLDKDYITCKEAWRQYKEYCEEYGVLYKLPYKKFKSELKEYFLDFKDRVRIDDMQLRNVYMYLNKMKIGMINKKIETNENESWLNFNCRKSLFDKQYKDCIAQLTKKDGTPKRKWENVTTKLKDIDTSELHYVKVPENHIVIDFDIKSDNGEKDLSLNLKEASKFPETYAELSKSGQGIHLHYIYDGDVDRLSRIYDNNIEIKVFKGNSSLRRKLTKCNNIDIMHISSGLPLRKEKAMAVPEEILKSESSIRKLIEKNLNKEIHANTAPSISFIKKILDEAYESGIKYDVSDLQGRVMYFATTSSNQKENCLKMVSEMKFKSDHFNEEQYVDSEIDKIVFYDVEVFPNLFVVCYKFRGEEDIYGLINPDPEEIEKILKYKLIGFNNKRYDNHILYARTLGYNNKELFNLSQAIINNNRNALFGNAYNLSYTDIYDFASAPNKMSLKKYEIKLKLNHVENSYPWDKPVPIDKWDEIVGYCKNDVFCTEKVFDYLEADWDARLMLAEIADMSPNTSTNTLTTKIIFGNEKNPELVYTDLREEFPEYRFEQGKSYYKDELIGEGGNVYAVPGMYRDVPVLDIASMHPHTIIALNYLGKYTKNFKELVDIRLAIKHGNHKILETALDGKLKRFIGDDEKCKKLSTALKTPINAVYGLTFANFNNAFKHPMNKDNIIAKRGALFMAKLKEEVEKRGFMVAHIKTDSIKIPGANKEIVDFVTDFGKQYGYTFEYESMYEKMCLVNDAVYIAKYSDDDVNGKKAGEWTATGTQFAVPYVFKSLFSHENIEFEDLTETKSVQTSMYLDFDESLEDVSLYEHIKDIRNKPIDKLTNKDKRLMEEYNNVSEEELDILISKGHDYNFVGKVGNFCPVSQGNNGGRLLRLQNDKYYAVTGTKDYRWMESAVIKENHIENIIDMNYFKSLVDDAVDNISNYCDIEEFID